MKKKVLAMVLTAVCAMGLMAGCGNSGNAATGTQNAATESGYKVGISQFAEHLNMMELFMWMINSKRMIRRCQIVSKHQI